MCLHSQPVVCLLLSCIEVGALATPIVSVDFDRASAGIQSLAQVSLGSPYPIDIMLDPVFAVRQTIGFVTVESSEVTLLPTGASGSDVLATNLFEMRIVET